MYATFFCWFEIDTSFEYGVSMVFFLFIWCRWCDFPFKRISDFKYSTHIIKYIRAIRCLQMRIVQKKNMRTDFFFHSMHHYHRTKAAKQPKIVWDENTHISKCVCCVCQLIKIRARGVDSYVPYPNRMKCKERKNVPKKEKNKWHIQYYTHQHRTHTHGNAYINKLHRSWLRMMMMS